jgi:aldehyde dehydrogenase (NAD+)
MSIAPQAPTAASSLFANFLEPTPATCLIDGHWQAAASGRALPLRSPVDGGTLGRLSRGEAADVDAAVASARRALAGPWGRSSALQRGRLLGALAQKVMEQLEGLADLEARDTGKPIGNARTDVRVLARYLEFYAGAADKVHGEVIPVEPGYHASLERVPLGVTAHIIAWNYPAQMIGRSIGPALAMGNAVVLKPSEEACLSCLAVADLARQVGFPAGTINLVTGLGEEAGAALAGHGDINLVTFIGSSAVGTRVQQAAAVNHVPVTLELGGKSPQIVFADADLDAAAAAVVRAGVQNAGQTCSAGSRVLVQRDIWDDFLARVAARMQALRVAVPADDGDLGPLISARQRERVQRYIDQARADGLPVLAETALPASLPAGGHWVAPVLFGPVPPVHPLAREEIFGPVLSALPFDDEAEALRLANDSRYGLVAAVWTRDGARQDRLARDVQVGQFFINCYGAGGGVELPFGGMKHSGHGREKGLAALEAFSTTKTVLRFHG